MTPFRLLFVTLFFLALSWSCNRNSTNPSPSTEEAVTTLYFVRHAEKASDGTNDPPLNKQGEARALRLRDLLLEDNITAIYSTAYQRTRQTATPLADSLQLDILPYDAHQLEVIEDIIATHRGGTILMVGHSNSTPRFVNYTLGRDSLNKLDEQEYDKLFKLRIAGEDKSLQTIVF